MKNRLPLLFLLGVLWAGALAPQASAAPVHNSEKGRKPYLAWLPTTFQSVDSGRPKGLDPVTILFYGGGPVNADEVATHLDSEWALYDKRGLFGRMGVLRWGTRNLNPLCRSAQDMFFIGPKWLHPEGTPGRGDYQNWSITGSTNFSCLQQYHGRFWSDRTHQRVFGAHTGPFVVGSVHHETLEFKKPPHTPDMDWDEARQNFVNGIDLTHCTGIWGVLPVASHMYQNLHWTGTVSRISMRHQAQGCNGA